MPSQELAEIMEGRLSLDQASPAVQSWARFPIHTKAKWILAQPREDRRSHIDALPPSLIGPVETEMVRLHRMRRPTPPRT